MKYTDLDIDIETLGTKYNSPILSIGAQAFSLDTGKMGPTFYLEVAFDSAVKSGVPSGSTIAWWLRQKDAALRLFAEDTEGKKAPLATALHGLVNFWRENCDSQTRVWGNGATFDLGILEYQFDVGAVGLSPPWQFKRIRDQRTIQEAAEVLALFDVKEVGSFGTHHNALADAQWGAAVICASWKALRDMRDPKGAPRAQPSKAPAPAPAIDDDEEL